MPFEKGKSGNPGGRPKEAAEVKRLAQEKGKEAIGKLVELLSCGEARTELAAAQAILDRGFGKPTQTIAGDEDNPITIAEVVRTIVKAEHTDG